MESDNAGSHDGNLWMRQQIDPNDDQNKQFYRAPYQVSNWEISQDPVNNDFFIF
jgi:hypothetical protein